MNNANALGFFLLGAFMLAAPSESIGYDVQSARVLWLQFMGLVTASIGSGFLMREVGREAMTAWNRFALRRAVEREQTAAASQQPASLGVHVAF